MFYEYAKHTRAFKGVSVFILFFHIFGAFLIKQLFQSRLLDILDDYSQLGAMRFVGYQSSQIKRAFTEYLLSKSLCLTI